MKDDIVEGVDLAFEIVLYILKKFNCKKIPLMIALLNAIIKNKKLKIKY
jgi:TctA family transporter